MTTKSTKIYTDNLVILNRALDKAEITGALRDEILRGNDDSLHAELINPEDFDVLYENITQIKRDWTRQEELKDAPKATVRDANRALYAKVADEVELAQDIRDRLMQDKNFLKIWEGEYILYENQLRSYIKAQQNPLAALMAALGNVS